MGAVGIHIYFFRRSLYSLFMLKSEKVVFGKINMGDFKSPIFFSNLGEREPPPKVKITDAFRRLQ